MDPALSLVLRTSFAVRFETCSLYVCFTRDTDVRSDLTGAPKEWVNGPNAPQAVSLTGREGRNGIRRKDIILGMTERVAMYRREFACEIEFKNTYSSEELQRFRWSNKMAAARRVLCLGGR